MTSKKWIFNVFIIVLIIFTSIMTFNFIIDPFQQYRVKTFYPIKYTSPRFRSAGFIKNENYDSIIVGASLSQNFLISEVTKKLNYEKTIKATIGGATAYEFRLLIESAIKNQKKLKNVFYSLNMGNFIYTVNRTKGFPFHLYNTNILNWHKYLLSTYTIERSIAPIYHMFNQKDPIFFDSDRMYEWQHEHKIFYTKDKFKSSILYQKSRQDKIRRESKIDVDKIYIRLKENFDKNLRPIIEDNPQISFKIFFPPHSIIYFKENLFLDEYLSFEKYLMDNLVKYNNVEVYNFHTAKKITHVIENYKDTSHFHQKVNSWILDQIKANNFRITEKNKDKFNQTLKKQINDFEADVFFSDSKKIY